MMKTPACMDITSTEYGNSDEKQNHWNLFAHYSDIDYCVYKTFIVINESGIWRERKANERKEKKENN